MLDSELLFVAAGNAPSDLNTLEKVAAALEDMDTALGGKLSSAATVGAGAGVDVSGSLSGGNLIVALKLATQAQAETGTDNTTGMSPLRTAQALAASRPVFARHSSAGVIAKQRGVSSITQLATGRYRCDFSAGRADANYAPGVIGSTDGSAPRIGLPRVGTMTTTSFEYDFINAGGTLVDPAMGVVFIME
ncbi:hypothetical protein J2T09_005549 [Neorhizobium huautlense]|uniref:Uncharacterized protein n=1 Tax=Neorhizobium huautlense TaxID=67774 RepID=A0ABT9Q1Z8_9HYPH|nr:hypothetical protein [Neorhizobium huautlense]